MAGFQQAFKDAISAWVDQTLEGERVNLGAASAKDWPDYQNRVGYIRALLDVQREIQTIEDQLQRG